MKKRIVRNGRRIVGFVYLNAQGEYWYAFGRPSQDNYIAFKCNDFSHGEACILMHSNICELKNY